ncbi:hypothetical protein MSAN_02132100 [Mycena sanguinolenta]|uniref:Protein kinase domain-containing protein n=1 Tax=Mycena sanguinolenta TaxID=230812 RepID=A0A8H6XHJ2_9AGAR|nr:hypothetical protein MSAN_02132100 [Mycena sanguinolenta]
MNAQFDPDPEFTHSATCDPQSPSVSGIFSRSRNFTVTGKNFTNIINNYPTVPGVPSDFRMITMGDIDLRHEIRVDSTGVGKQERVRRIYSARVEGRKENLTVAIYQGDDAEEKWRQDVARYMSMCHPNIIQIWGVANSNHIHATLFNDDLIPLSHFLDQHRYSHFLTVYIYACCNQDFRQVHDYIFSTFQQFLSSLDCTTLIRRSTGRLCIELTKSSETSWLEWWQPELPGLSPTYRMDILETTNANRTIQSLPVGQYYEICYLKLAQHRFFAIPAGTLVNLGAILHFSSNLYQDSVEIASHLYEEPDRGHWDIDKGGVETVLKDGWTRFQSSDVPEGMVHLCISVNLRMDPWLSQANYIFRQLHIMSDFEDYGTTSSLIILFSIR